MNNHVRRAPFLDIERKKEVAKSKERFFCFAAVLFLYVKTYIYIENYHSVNVGVKVK